MPPCTTIDKIRNIGIIAHIDAGKTTLSERILYYASKIHRMGEVHDGAATMDFLPEEQERGITITSACTTCKWEDKIINLVDTPGHVDFTIEVERCLRVLDGAVGVFCSVAGVEPQSETVWRQSEEFCIPKIAFVNKMDRIGADFSKVLEAINSRLAANAVAVNIPLGAGESFCGILDLICQEKIVFNQDDLGRTFSRTPFSREEKEKAAPWREKMLEKIADCDDLFLAKWLNGGFTADDVYAAIKRATSARKCVPVLCGSALKNTGIQPLLDAVCNYLPSPLETAPIVASKADDTLTEIIPDPDSAPVGLIFKVVMENGRKISLLRLYSGHIAEGETLLNSRLGKIERVNKIFRLHADAKENISQLCAGDIAAIAGLRLAKTGDTYSGKDIDVKLEPLKICPPVITLALEPFNGDEGKILDEALARYSEEDPTLQVNTDEETSLRMISGMGELHLEIILERIRREYRIMPRVGQPQVIMRETIQKTGDAEVYFDKEFGKERHQAHLKVLLEPQPRGTGSRIITGDFLPKDPHEAKKFLPDQYVAAAVDGVKQALLTGTIAGWPVTDIIVTINDIEKTDLITVPGCHMAAVQAVQEALKSSLPVLLEPMMKVEISVPDDFLGSAINLFNQTGGKIENILQNGDEKILHGFAPLKNLFGFSTSLRSATQGRAAFVMAFDRFDRV